MQEILMDIDQIIANNKKPLSPELNAFRQRVTSETTKFMEKYQEINDEIESEVVDKVLNLYMEYYAAVLAYLRGGYSKGYGPKSTRAMDNDNILSMFRKILDFDEMECLQIPDMEMAKYRREQLIEARNYLILENFDRSSYEAYLNSLEDYENQLEDICTDLERTKEDPFRDEKLADCMAQLKFLRNKFKMRLLLYDLGKFYEGL